MLPSDERLALGLLVVVVVSNGVIGFLPQIGLCGATREREVEVFGLGGGYGFFKQFAPQSHCSVAV